MKPLTAYDVPDNEWLMVIRTKRWFKKTGLKKEYVTASVIGDKKEHLIPRDEKVMLRK